MKTLYLLLIGMGCSSLAMAQKFNIGVKAGAELQKLDGQTFKQGFSFGYQLGGFARIGIGRKLGIQPEVLFFADSNGAMFPSQVEKLIRFAREQVDIPLGFHAHDNLGFAVANAMAAVTGGARWIDSTVGGLGKGGGNASTEAILTLVAGLTGRTIQLSRLLDAVSIYPEGLFPPRMQSRIESSLFGLYNCNLETIARLKAVATDNFEQIHEQLQAMSINHELPVDCLSEKLKCWWRSAVCGLTTG